jgi:hypothetical protein
MNREVKAGFFVCASICGKDGVISEVEELSIVSEFESAFGLKKIDIEQLFDDFFNSPEHIDTYLSRVKMVEIRKTVYEVSKLCASSDDLDIRENIALERTRKTWGLD